MQKKNIKINKIMNSLQKHFQSKRKTTLNRMRKKPNAYKILISCLLSLRTKDENTENVSSRLFKIASTPQQISKMPTRKLEKIIYSSGHYKKKARTLKYVSKVLLEKYQGKVPNNEEDLLSIKGIGRKTANIVLSFAFNKTVIPVDVNVHRVSNRLGWLNTKKADDTEKQLMKILPKKFWKEINSLFILHGKNICVPISPKCSTCPIKNLCKKININKSR